MRPDFALACIKANEILMNPRSGIEFPLPLSSISKDLYGIPCRTYAIAALYNIDIHAFGSESGLLICKNDKRIIFYDEKKCDTHCYFTKAHELGHHVLDHELNPTSNLIYRKQEKEANYFAAQLTMPHQLISLLKEKSALTAGLLSHVFGVSYPAASNRLESYPYLNVDSWTEDETRFDKLITQKFAYCVQYLQANWYRMLYQNSIRPK